MDYIKQACALRKRSRALLTFMLLTTALSQAHCQTFAEWFSQRKTQKKYLLQQIAALQVYSGYLKTGYDIAKGGLGKVSTYLDKEYSLHNSHYRSLKAVNKVVKKSPQVNEILGWQQDILQQTAAIKKQSGLTSQEKDHTSKVCSALLKDCDALLSDLETILTYNKAEMDDEERIWQIARLHAAMQDNYCFACHFIDQLKQYVFLRQQDQSDKLNL